MKKVSWSLEELEGKLNQPEDIFSMYSHTVKQLFKKIKKVQPASSITASSD